MKEKKEGWKFTIMEFPYNPALNIAVDEVLAESVAVEKLPPIIRLWRNPNTLILGRFHYRVPHIEKGIVKMRKLGVNLTTRISGGGIVPQDKGCINISMILPRFNDLDFDRGYTLLWSGVMNGFQGDDNTGWSYGKVNYTFCDGTYNLLLRGRKIGGAAIIRRKNFLLIQGTLLVSSDLKWIARIANQFYKVTEMKKQVKTKSLTTLSHEIDGTLTFHSIAEKLFNGYKNQKYINHLDLHQLTLAKKINIDEARATKLQKQYCITKTN